MGGVRWSERLRGHLSFDQTDFNLARLEGERDGAAGDLLVHLQIDDIERFIAARVRTASIVGGCFDAPDLLGNLEVKSGQFDLLTQERGLFDHLHLRMRYRINMRDPSGNELRMSAFKLVENDPGYDSWLDVTTLFARIYRGYGPDSAYGPVELRVDDGMPREDPDEAPDGPVGPDAPARDGDQRELERVRALRWLPEIEPGEARDLLATAVLRISPAGFLAELTTFRGTEGSFRDKLRDTLAFGRCFSEGLAKAYVGRPIRDGRPSYPRDRAPEPWRTLPGEWEPVPGREWPTEGRPVLERRVYPYHVPDLSFPLNLHRLCKDRDEVEAPGRTPVLLVPGAGLRADMFYGQPLGRTLVDHLLDEGFDVWVQNWRASIDLPANSYTLDAAAHHDHPEAVRTVMHESGAAAEGTRMAAVVHCMGSASFVMAAVAGLLPENAVSNVVSNGISLYFKVSYATFVKQRATLPFIKVFGTGADPQWGIRAQTPAGAALAMLARRMQRPCGNGACQVANFIYGSGKEVLLRHDNVTDEVHAWGAGQLGYAPFSLIDQVSESCRYGEVVSAGTVPGMGSGRSGRLGYTDREPRSGDTRFTFIGGTRNEMFDWRGQQETDAFLKRFKRPSRFVPLPGYGHLDAFWGRNCEDEVWPVIESGLRWDGRSSSRGPYISVQPPSEDGSRKFAEPPYPLSRVHAQV